MQHHPYKREIKRRRTFGIISHPDAGKTTLTEKLLLFGGAIQISGFVFKIQANMDPAHRDRIAFLRICSGKFTLGMKVFHHRLGKEITLANATIFMAKERSNVEEAYAGDIIGIYNHGTIKIGDTPIWPMIRRGI